MPWTVNRLDLPPNSPFSSYPILSGSTLSFDGVNPQLNGAGEIINPITLGSDGLKVTASAHNRIAFANQISGSGPLIIDSGTVRFLGAAANSYAGLVVNAGGIAFIEKESDLGKASAAGADITLNGGEIQFSSVPALSATRRISLIGTGASPNVITAYNNPPTPFLGEITGPGALTVFGDLQLANANSYAGGTIVGSSTLPGLLGITRPEALGTGNSILVNKQGVLAPSYPVDQALIQRIDPTSSGTIALGADSASELDFQAAGLASARLGAINGNFTYSGQLTPAGTVYNFGASSGELHVATTLSGARSVQISQIAGPTGTVVFESANSYSGGTAIDTNMTLLTGTSGSTGSGRVIVHEFGHFGGSGMALGGVTLEHRGRLEPGLNGIGGLTTGDVTSSGGEIVFTLAGEVAGTGYDQLRVLGQVSLGDSILTLTLAYQPAIGTKFIVIDNDQNDPILGRFSGLQEGAVFNLTNGKGGPASSFQISYVGGTGNDVEITTVPEPCIGSYLIMAGAFLAFSKRRGG